MAGVEPAVRLELPVLSLRSCTLAVAGSGLRLSLRLRYSAWWCTHRASVAHVWSPRQRPRQRLPAPHLVLFLVTREGNAPSPQPYQGCVTAFTPPGNRRRAGRVHPTGTPVAAIPPGLPVSVTRRLVQAIRFRSSPEDMGRDRPARHPLVAQEATDIWPPGQHTHLFSCQGKSGRGCRMCAAPSAPKADVLLLHHIPELIPSSLSLAALPAFSSVRLSQRASAEEMLRQSLPRTPFSQQAQHD